MKRFVVILAVVVFVLRYVVDSSKEELPVF